MAVLNLLSFKLLIQITFQIGECVDPKIRGILGSLPSIFMSLAILTSYIIGSLVKWDILAWYCAAMAGKHCCVRFRTEKLLHSTNIIRSIIWLAVALHTRVSSLLTQVVINYYYCY